MVDKKKKTELAFKLSYLNRNFSLILGYLNRALNIPALDYRVNTVNKYILKGALWCDACIMKID